MAGNGTRVTNLMRLMESGNIKPDTPVRACLL
jgi:hypothetical protein